MVLNKFTGSTQMDGTEKPLYKIVGSTMKHFMAYTYLKALQAGESLRLRVYNKVDDVSHWKLDGDVTDSVGGNNGTVTNISSLVSQWKFDGNVNDSVGSNNGTITYHTNLKALYKFDGTINDSTSGAHNLTLAAGTTTYVTGQEGQAVSFDGSTYYTANSAVVVTGTGDRTVSFWLYTPSTFVTNSSIFSWGATSNNNGFGASWNSTASTSALLFYGFNNDIVSNTIFQPNTWYHLVLTLSSSGTVRTIYVNGIQDKQSTTTALNTTSSSLFIANFYGGGQIIQSGSRIDEFRIYSIAATQAQVSALYMNGKFAQSHTFDGASGVIGAEYIQVGSAATWDFMSNASAKFSLSFWIKSTGKGLLFDTSSWGNNTGIVVQTAGTAGLLTQITNSTPSNVVQHNDTSMTKVQDGNWHHVVWTYDQSLGSNNSSLYLDGVLSSHATKTANAPSTPPFNTLTMGARSNATQQEPFGGQLDDVRVYSDVLTASQVLGLYNYTGSNYITPLPVGNALSLDGSSYVTVTNQTPYNFERTNSFSISAWINTSKLTTDLVIFSKQNTAYTDKGYSLRIGTNNHFIINIVNTFASNAIIKQTSNSYNDGNWHNVIVTYAGTSAASGVNFYVDGVLVSMTTTQDNLSATITNTNNACIGSINNNLNWVGLLDEVQVFNYVVSAAEINAINSGRFANTHPIGLWHFDGDLYDYSGQGSTGSPTGTMTYVTGALSGSYNVPNTHFNFDGSEYISVGNPTNLQFELTQPMSFSFWVKQPSAVAFIPYITKWSGSVGYGVDCNGSGQMEFFLISSSGRILVHTTTSISDNLWHHIVWTYTGSPKASNVSLYIDGVSSSVTIDNDNLSGTILNSTNVTIGFENTDPVLSVYEMDDVRIYNRALSSAEVSDLYTYPDSAMKSLVYDKTYTGVVSDTKYIVPLQGNQIMVTAQQLNGTNRIITWEREEVS